MRDEVLLEGFAKRGDATAFRQLVERYTPVVYAAARRQIRDVHLAEDVTQAVFVLLARKAASIRDAGTLPAWLISATRLCALATVREEVRRKAREARVAAAAPTIDTSHPAGSTEQPMTADARAVERAVDEALCHLSDKDRTAVVLRYLQGKSQREVADAMGVSENAAAQRLSRAVARLRKFFSARGVMLATVVATELALEKTSAAAAALIPPTGLATTAANTALSPAATAGTAGVVHAIADTALSTLRRKAAITLAAASLGVLLLLTIIGLAVNHLTRGGAKGGQTVAGATIPNSATPSSRLKSPIRVGVYVSAASADPLPPKDNAWYDMVVIADDLKGEKDMDVVPITEPGTAENPKQKRLLGVYFPGKAPVDVMDTAALRQLDVIVTSFVHTPPQRALESVAAAVQNGTGLFIRRCFGNHEPQIKTAVSMRLRGFATNAPEMNMRGKPNEWVVLERHPILGSLTPESKPIVQRATGVWGTLVPGAVPLIRLRHVECLIPTAVDEDGVPTPGVITPQDTTGDIVYLHQVGKGRVVCCNFLAQTPAELQEATNNRFTALSVKWLAGRPVE